MEKEFYSYKYEHKDRFTAVVVLGILVSNEYHTEYGARAVDVEPVTDSELIQKITEKLGNQGTLSFWE